MELTRRTLVSAALAPAAIAAGPQAAPPQDQLLAAAWQRNQANFAAVAKVELPMPTEPSFQFKP